MDLDYVVLGLCETCQVSLPLTMLLSNVLCFSLVFVSRCSKFVWLKFIREQILAMSLALCARERVSMRTSRKARFYPCDVALVQDQAKSHAAVATEMKKPHSCWKRAF